jgi:hypothetical protein
MSELRRHRAAAVDQDLFGCALSVSIASASAMIGAFLSDPGAAGEAGAAG